MHAWARAIRRRAPWLGALRDRLPRIDPADALSLACLAALSWVMLATLPDYGLTYDEEPHIRYGERVLRFYASGFQSELAPRSSYGSAFDVCAALLRRISLWDAYRTNHILCVFIAQVGLLGTWRLGRLVTGSLGGLLSLLFLALTPVYYGHQFNNPKDIPFAAGYVWGLYFIARLLLACSPRPGLTSLAASSLLGGWPFWGKLALALGLGMSVRVGGAVLIGYLLLFLALVSLDSWRSVSRAAALALGGIWWRAAFAIALGWAMVIVSWPRAFESPLEGPKSAIDTVTKFTAYDSPTLLRGQLIPSQKVPWDYLPTYFAIQLPEFTTFCFLASVAGALVITGFALARRGAIPWAWLLLLTAVALPPAYAILRHSTLYNGLRHFLFIIPPISVMAGGAVAELTRWAARRRRVWAGVVLAIMGIFSIDQIAASVRLHPHQHTYFNRLSGGLARAIDRYETEYYGSVYQELNARLAEQVWTTRRAEYLNRTFVVTGCGSNLFFKRNLPLNFQYTAMRYARDADYYATYARDGCLQRLRDRALVTRVHREGADLGVARDMKRAAPRGAARAP